MKSVNNYLSNTIKMSTNLKILKFKDFKDIHRAVSFFFLSKKDHYNETNIVFLILYMVQTHNHIIFH